MLSQWCCAVRQQSIIWISIDQGPKRSTDSLVIQRVDIDPNVFVDTAQPLLCANKILYFRACSFKWLVMQYHFWEYTEIFGCVELLHLTYISFDDRVPSDALSGARTSVSTATSAVIKINHDYMTSHTFRTHHCLHMLKSKFVIATINKLVNNLNHRPFYCFSKTVH